MRSSEMDAQVDWVKLLIADYVSSLSRVGRVVIFGHSDSSTFLGDLADYVQDDLQNSVPILYVQGNDHRWQYTPVFQGQPSMVQIVLEGGSEPALKVTVNNDGTLLDTATAFPYDRR